jgi:hypothetical protein
VDEHAQEVAEEGRDDDAVVVVVEEQCCYCYFVGRGDAVVEDDDVVIHLVGTVQRALQVAVEEVVELDCHVLLPRLQLLESLRSSGFALAVEEPGLVGPKRFVRLVLELRRRVGDLRAQRRLAWAYRHGLTAPA